LSLERETFRTAEPTPLHFALPGFTFRPYVLSSGNSGRLLAGLAVAAAVGAGWYRPRYARLQQRTRQATSAWRNFGTLTGGLATKSRTRFSTISLNLQLLREDLPDVPSRGD